MTTTTTNGGEPATNGAVAALLSEVKQTLTRLDFARQHGLQYGGDRDIYKVGGYPEALKFSDFEALYERDGTAGQIVDMAAETTWRTPPEVVEPGQEDGTKFTQAWEDLVKAQSLWQRFERADRLSRIGRYSVLLIGAAGDDAGLGKELKSLRRPEAILYLAAYAEGHAKVASWVTDPTDPRFGLPEKYKIDLSSGVANFMAAGGSNTVEVHHSRVLHIAEGLSGDEVHGRPALKRVYNDLHDLQKVRTATGEAYWQLVTGILQAIIDPEAQVTQDQLSELDEALQKLYHDLKRTFYGRGIELSRLAAQTPDPEAAANLYMTLIAAGAGYPKRMLFGSETGERASTEDQKTYLGSIAERQRQHAEPAILRAFIDRLIDLGALPKPGADGYEVVWPPLFQESEKEVAEANKARAESAKALTPIGGDPMTLVEVDADRNVWLRPTGERGELTPAELEPEEPEPAVPPDPDAPEDGDEPEPEAERT